MEAWAALPPTYRWALLAWLGLGIVAFVASLFLRAPYGRHIRPGWGPTLPNRVGWLVMELPVLVVFYAFFLGGNVPKTSAHWVFAGLFTLHYSYRALVFPFLLRTAGKRMPLSVAGMAVLFNLGNGYFLGHWLGNLSAAYPNGWMLDPQFLTGLLCFLGGFSLNVWADNRLIHLRKPGETGYRIPYGGMFRYVSCPNHFGEMVEWLGFALLTASAPAAVFAAWTVLNVLPRSLAHHRWYRDRFADYPAARKAVWPFVL
jgi:hypothetical protein